MNTTVLNYYDNIYIVMPKKSENLRKNVLNKETLLKAREQLQNLKRDFARRENKAQQDITFLNGELQQCEEDHAKCVEELEYLRKYLQARVNIERAGGGSRRRRKRRKRRKSKRKKKRRRKRTRKGGKIYSRRTKRMRPYVIVKIDRDPVNYKQKGGFLGDALGGLAKSAMGAVGGDMGGLAKTAMGALGGKDGLKKMGRDILGRAKGGLMDKIGGFARGLGGGAVGAMMGKFSGGSVSGENLLSGEPSVKLESCDPSERPEYPKGPDGCGKHESPKATVQQLKQGFVDDSQVYQLEEY